MKWRCTWCGKPHAENDPPCDACGHNAFEKAIVRADDGSGGRSERQPGRSESAPETVDTGTEYVWACTNCGREHARNTPPCSRCGDPDLERVERTYEGLERDLTPPSWFAVAKPYLPILVVLGIVVALFATGIGPPSSPDAPGETIEAAEGEVHERFEAERNSAEQRAYDDGLAAYAEYQNRRSVANAHGERDPERANAGEFDLSCGDARPLGVQAVLTGASVADADESELADAIAAELLNSEYGDDVRTGFDAEGLDAHRAPNGDVYVFYAAC